MKRNQRPPIVTTMILLTWIAATGATVDEIDQVVDKVEWHQGELFPRVTP